MTHKLIFLLFVTVVANGNIDSPRATNTFSCNFNSQQSFLVDQRPFFLQVKILGYNRHKIATEDGFGESWAVTIQNESQLLNPLDKNRIKSIIGELKSIGVDNNILDELVKEVEKKSSIVSDEMNFSVFETSTKTYDSVVLRIGFLNQYFLILELTYYSPL